jgi:hypothetical protein
MKKIVKSIIAVLVLLFASSTLVTLFQTPSSVIVNAQTTSTIPANMLQYE